MTYDKSNIFAKILRKEISCEKIYEDEEVFSFKDINPLAPVHILVIPKGEYISFNDFIEKAEHKTITSFFKKVQLILNKYNLKETGYRIITNHGLDANQEVPHFHIHILGGENLGGIKGK